MSAHVLKRWHGEAIYQDTVLVKFPLFCSTCKKEIRINVVQMKKNRKFQVEQLEKEGYTEIRSFYVEK